MNWVDYIIEFYILIPVVLFIAPALFAAGANSLGQSKTVDIFILVQGTIVGHLAALTFQLEGFIEITLCYLFATISLCLSHLMLRAPKVYHSSLRIGLYAFLLVAIFVFERWVPGLERHINSAFVGDLLYLSNYKAISLIILAILYLIYFSKNYQNHTQRIFYKNVLKINFKTPATNHLFNFILLVSSTHFMGLSFTLGFAVLLPLIFSIVFRQKSLKYYFIYGAILCALFGSFSLIISFLLPNQSTTPLIVIISTVIACSLYFVRFREQ